jgi:hypothetical protein
MPNPFEQGTPLTLEIDIGSESVVTKAEVRYTRERAGAPRPEDPPGMGVVFRDLAPAMDERLARFLAEQDRRFGL